MKTLTRIELRDNDTSQRGDSLLDYKYFLLEKERVQEVSDRIEQLRQEWYEEEDPECMTSYIWAGIEAMGIEEDHTSIDQLEFEV